MSESCAWHNHQITVTYLGFGIFRLNNQKNWCWTNSLYPVITYSSGAAVWTDILDYNWSVSTSVIYHGWYVIDYAHQTLGQAVASHRNFGNKTQTNSMYGLILGNYSYSNSCGY